MPKIITLQELYAQIEVLGHKLLTQGSHLNDGFYCIIITLSLG
jgi:hypothetical protein